MLNFLFGKNGGLKKSDLEKASRRNKFSDYLPYIAFDEETSVYYNKDNTIGYVWECSPVSFAGEDISTTLGGLFRRLGLPNKSVIQFFLYSDDYIEPILNNYETRKKRNIPIINNAIKSLTDYYVEGKKGLNATNNIPLRNFRLIVSVKMDVKLSKELNIKEIKHNIEEILTGARLYPSYIKPSHLLELLRQIINDTKSKNDSLYDEKIPISKQIIKSESVIKADNNNLYIGKRFFRCTTPKLYPKEIDEFKANQLVGGIWGVISDPEQIRTPFIYNVNVIINKKLKTDIHMKCNLVLQQQGFGSLAPSLARKKEEYMWAVDELEKEKQFVQIIPTFWVWDTDETKVYQSIARVKRIWEDQGFIMQEDKGILPILFISSLPFGLYTAGDNIGSIDRDFIAPADVVQKIIPIQADYAGSGYPEMVFVGRKGQIVSMDLFDQRSNNYNAYVAAATGSGKSFLVNYVVFNYFAAGDKIRIIDLGGSYKKLVNMFNGRLIEFDKSSNIRLNPFTHIKEFDQELNVISDIIWQMTLSATDKIAISDAETASTLIKQAIKWAYDAFGNNADIDNVYHYLDNYTEITKDNTESVASLAKTIAFNLKEFTSDGIYGKWFNGPSNFDISSDDFVLLELEELKSQPEIFKVVTLQIINAVTRDMYLSDRNSRRMVIFDEAWQFLEDSNIIQRVIEEGYRRARKYRGSFTIITQSILDLKRFGSVGDVIMGNSDYKFFLQSTDFQKAKKEGLIDYSDFVMKILQTVKSNKPKYSEIFVDSPSGIGVVRLVVDPFSYYIYTSDPSEIAEINNMVKNNMTYTEAINEMVKKYRSK